MQFNITNDKLVLIVFILLIIISFFCILEINNNKKLELMVNISSPPKVISMEWMGNKNCKYSMSKILKETLKKFNINKANGNNWVIHIPCTYNNINKEIVATEAKNENQRIFIIDNADQISGKNMLWDNLVKKYGRDKASKLMPQTYLLYVKKDIELFNKEYDPKKIYILKKNIQRQKGLMITKNKEEILKGFDDNYVIVQELLQDPYIIRGRKINMRFYLLIVCNENKIGAYVHKDGFMYYTKDNFIKGSVDTDSNITTGYIDRKVYEINPLTHEDFRMYLDKTDRCMTDEELNLLANNDVISKIVFDRVYELLKETIVAMDGVICKDSYLKNYISFQLFGVDIAINNKLIPQLIEINKGPDLGTKDKRDSKVKHTVMEDIFRVLKLVPKENLKHDFISIY